jgi:hypothetical protein
MNRTFLAATLLALPFAAAPTEPAPAAAKAEIDHLFDFVAHSDCRFYRNGSWHGMDEARDHLALKYEYLAPRGKADSAEAFIENGASRSSFSGKDYLVECPGSAAVPSNGWLRAELERFRRPRS